MLPPFVYPLYGLLYLFKRPDMLLQVLGMAFVFLFGARLWEFWQSLAPLMACLTACDVVPGLTVMQILVPLFWFSDQMVNKQHDQASAHNASSCLQ